MEPISFDLELMEVPSFDLVLPIDWIDVFDGWEEIKLYINGKCFYGLVWDIEHNKVEETVKVMVRHIISEWEHRQISVNHAKSDGLNVIYKGDEIEIDKKTGETITASDFSISRRALKNMTTGKWVKKASATAWVTSNGDKVKVTHVDKDDVKKKEGDYNVTFSTDKGTSIKVKCSVKDSVQKGSKKSNKSKANGETIQAYAITIDVDLGYDAEDVQEKIKAKAWKTGDKKDTVPVTSYSTDFKNEVGVYLCTASTAKGTSVTVKVTVEDGTGYGETDPSIVDNLEDIYNSMEFAYPGWNIQFQGDAGAEMIDYVYSKQNKLEALTQTMELTENLFWRISWINWKKVEIGEFGEKKPYTVSVKPSGEHNIRIIEEPTIDYDFENVINVATVYSDKSDSGMASLTLREVYNDEALIANGKITDGKRLQNPKFPVIILRGNVNNEADYSRLIAPTQSPKIAPNNELEYAVLDLDSIATESGRLIEGSFGFNDLNPFNTWEEATRITDKKRIRAAKAVYKAAIRKLKQNRRSINITMKVEEIPPDLLPGDKVRFIYDNDIWNIEACSSFYKKMLRENDDFYITRISYDIDENEVETNEITLSKWIKIMRETQA